jgi:hypothetical protein
VKSGYARPIAGILLVALGLARGLGGTLLLLHGAANDPAIIAPPGVVTAVGVGLVALGLLAIGSGTLALLGGRGAFPAGVAVLTLFLVDAAVNGRLLFGNPRLLGMAIDLATALLIVGLLLAGRRRVAERRDSTVRRDA